MIIIANKKHCAMGLIGNVSFDSEKVEAGIIIIIYFLNF